MTAATNPYGISGKDAHGGVIGAAVGGARTGMTLVGEHGPELLKIPGGSRVFSNPDSQSMMSAGGGVNVSLEIGSSSNADFDKFMLQWVRNNVRVKGGGSVQQAFGRS